MRWRITSSGSDITTFGAEKSFTSNTITYPQPIQLDSGDIRLFYRRDANGSGWVFRESTDTAESFGAEIDLLTVGSRSVYTHPISDGSKIYFATGDHRLDPPNIFAFYYDSTDSTYYKSDGTQITTEGNLPITSLDDLTTAVDLTNPTKIYDHQLDSNGNPVAAFTEHVETGTGGGDGDYRARWAKFDGSQWIVGSEITDMGGSLPEDHYYEGGLSLDAKDPSTVYVSVETENRNYQIQEWSTDDDGASWSKVRNVSDAGATIVDPTKRGRPISPRNYQDDTPVLWWEGRYDDFTDYRTRIQRLQP